MRFQCYKGDISMKIRRTWNINPKTRVKDAKKRYKRSVIKKESYKLLKEEKINEN